MSLPSLKKVAELDFPTHWAHFRLLAFESICANTESTSSRVESTFALILGDIYSSPPIVRIHSQCITGDIFHSLRCDCHDQLHLALRMMVGKGAGILVYEQQEGRGIGLMEKLRAYELQDHGYDTIEANHRLGHPADLRDFALPVQILVYLRVLSVRLLTNNPDKINAVMAAGIEVAERLNANVPITPHSARYMATKRDRLGHLLDETANSALEQLARPDVDREP